MGQRESDPAPELGPDAGAGRFAPRRDVQQGPAGGGTGVAYRHSGSGGTVGIQLNPISTRLHYGQGVNVASGTDSAVTAKYQV